MCLIVMAILVIMTRKPSIGWGSKLCRTDSAFEVVKTQNDIENRLNVGVCHNSRIRKYTEYSHIILSFDINI